MGTQKNRLNETVLLSTQNKTFHNFDNCFVKLNKPRSVMVDKSVPLWYIKSFGYDPVKYVIDCLKYWRIMMYNMGQCRIKVNELSV